MRLDALAVVLSVTLAVAGLGATGLQLQHQRAQYERYERWLDAARQQAQLRAEELQSRVDQFCCGAAEVADTQERERVSGELLKGL